MAYRRLLDRCLWAGRAGLGSMAAALALAATVTTQAHAQATNISRSASEQGLRWAELTPAQRDALKPLENEWPSIEGRRKDKWIELSARMPTMAPSERARVQERMAEWARLTPQQRGEARVRYQEARQLSTQDRQARWEAYQALTPEQRQRFAASAPKSVAASPHGGKPGHDSPPQIKSNIVPDPAAAPAPQSVAPTVVRASPGATTTLITKRPAPPGHQQTGLPKIVATPGFVDKATLLPRRGPQSAVTPSAASAPTGTPAR